MQYRAEIDGLRSIAVVPVILFHAGFDLFDGGFVGVDVFFVIRPSADIPHLSGFFAIEPTQSTRTFI